MEPTYYDMADLETRQNWERELHFEVLKNVSIFNPKYGFVGEEPNKLVQRRKKAFEQGGTSATVTLLRQLRGTPTRGNRTMRDREEGLDTSTFKYVINKARHAVSVDGEIVENRVTWDVYDSSKTLLGEYWAKVLEAGAMMHLAGFNINANRTFEFYLNGAAGSDFTGNNDPKAPDAWHMVRPGDHTADEDIGLDPSAVLDPDLISECVARAKLLPVPIRPIDWHGEKIYVLFVHTNQVKHLRQKHSDWYATMQAALQGGAFKENPLFTGALGFIDGTLLVESNVLPPGVSSADSSAVLHTRRAVFCGAQALTLGLGKRYTNENQFKLVEEKWDYGDKWGCSAGLIYGLAAPRYTLSEDDAEHDFGKIVLTTYAKDSIVEV